MATNLACASTGPAVPNASDTTVATAATTATQLGTTSPTTPTTPTTTVPPIPDPLFVFAAPGSIDGWRATNDTVMGGVSIGALRWDGGAMVFAGELSLDNNGGFASAVSPAVNGPAWASADGLSLDVTGDGRSYTLQVRTASSGYWIQRFPTVAGTAERLLLPWSGFEPVGRFLNPVAAPGPLDPADVEAVVIYLVDGQEGPFRLSVRSLG